MLLDISKLKQERRGAWALVDVLRAELAAEREARQAAEKDAERWSLIESHWSAADIKNNRDGSFKSMTITFKTTQVSDEQNREKLRCAFDDAIAQGKVPK